MSTFTSGQIVCIVYSQSLQKTEALYEETVGWNPSMATLNGKVGIVKCATSLRVSVRFFQGGYFTFLCNDIQPFTKNEPL